MIIPVSTRLYLYPAHDLMSRVWILLMGIKVYLYHAHTHIGG
jgi:hypothetical protein